MRTNLLLAVTAVVYALTGAVVTFLAEELLRAVGVPTRVEVRWLLQALGAALLALGWLNWIQRHTVTAGIHGRAVVLPNLLFALVLALNAFSAFRGGAGAAAPLLGGLAIGFGVIAVAFGSRIFVRAPVGAA
jgi:hypothetical protein